MGAVLNLRAEAPLKVTDMMGKTVRLEPRSGSVKVTLSGSPLYVQGQAFPEGTSVTRGVTRNGFLDRLRRVFS